jgi:dTDP-4-dehydrorhamnose reductase
MKILVTGANGQLGKCIQEAASHCVKNKYIDWCFKTSAELDVTNKKDIDRLFNSTEFNYLVNCSAYTAVDKAEEEEERAFLVNSEAVKNLAVGCLKNNITFIHISTDFVFDGKKNEPYTEEDIPNPINIYGESKLKGEKYIQDILVKYFIIRTSWVYSEYGNNFVKTMLRLKDKKELNIVCDQIGSPTYARDLAEFIIHLIVKKQKTFGIFNYSNEGEESWFDFAQMIFKINKTKISLKPIKSVDYLFVAERPLFSVLNKSKTKNIIKVDISNWKHSLFKCMENIKQNNICVE